MLPVLVSLASLAGAAAPPEPAQLPQPREGEVVRHAAGSIAGIDYGFVEYVPKGHAAAPTPGVALIVFLHGTGERGNGGSDLARLDRAGPLMLLGGKGDALDLDDVAGKRAAVVLAPQLPAEKRSYDADAIARIDAIVRAVATRRRVDPARCYLTGVSLGGGGVWNYLRLVTGRFAAAAPVCGALPPTIVAKAVPGDLARVPVWAFHALRDPVVPFAWSPGWCDRIAGERAKAAVPAVLAALPKDLAGETATAHWNAREGWSWSGVTPGCAKPGVGVPQTRSGDPLRLTRYHHDNHDLYPEVCRNGDVWRWIYAQSR